MIELSNVSDRPKIGGSRKMLAADVTLEIPPGRYAVLSRDATLNRHALDILTGARPPAQGDVTIKGISSWAIGRPGFMRGKITGFHVIALVSRLYALDQTMCIAFVREMLTNPSVLDDRMEHWPGPARQEFGHALSLLPPFDIYVVDGTFPFLRNRFSALWAELFAARTKGRMLILSTTRAKEAKAYCDKAIILQHGRMEIDHDLEHAIAKYPPRPAAMAVQDDAENDAADDPDADLI